MKKTGTILYVEDNVSNIELVTQTLASQRPEVKLFSISEGKQTLPQALEIAPDLILLDLNLPDIHGSEVLDQLLADEKTKLIPVIIISADAMPQQLTKLIKAGAKKYLTKPLDLMEFLKVIDEYIH